MHVTSSWVCFSMTYKTCDEFKTLELYSVQIQCETFRGIKKWHRLTKSFTEIIKKRMRGNVRFLRRQFKMNKSSHWSQLDRVSCVSNTGLRPVWQISMSGLDISQSKMALSGIGDGVDLVFSVYYTRLRHFWQIDVCPHQIYICQKCLRLVLETKETRFIKSVRTSSLLRFYLQIRKCFPFQNIWFHVWLDARRSRK